MLHRPFLYYSKNSTPLKNVGRYYDDKSVVRHTKPKDGWKNYATMTEDNEWSILGFIWIYWSFYDELEKDIHSSLNIFEICVYATILICNILDMVIITLPPCLHM